MSKFWDIQPLHTSIIELLLKNGGSLTTTELHKVLEKSHHDLSFRKLNQILLKLEVEGVIHVFNLTKNMKRVELRKM